MGQYQGTGTFTKITTTTDLADGYYVIAYGESFAMNNTHNGTYLGNTAITVVSGSIANPAAAIVWKIETTTNGKSIYNEASAKYVSYTGSSNNVQIVDAVSGKNQEWTITGSASLFGCANAALTTRKLQYNTSSPRFACYAGSQQDLTFYKLTETSTPTLSASETTINFGTAVVGSTAPTKTFTLTGSNLTGNVSLISDNPAFTISPASPYTPTSGTVNQTVTVTYTPSASPATHTGKLTISSASATSIEINLSGETILGTPVATAATDIQQSSFTANWNAVSGAGSYILNVYKKVGTAEVTVFSENFDKFTAGSPNAGANGTDVSDPTKADIDTLTQTSGWSGSKIYQAGGTAKMGTSSALGSITTPAIDLSAESGAFKVSIDAMAWNGDATDLNVYLDDVLVHTIAGLNNSTYTMSNFTFNLAGGTASSKIKLEGKQLSNSRFFIDNLIVTQGGTTDTPIQDFPKNVGNVTSLNITGLDASTVYYYDVKAVSGSVESLLSNEIEVTTASTVGISKDQIDGASVFVKDGNVVVKTSDVAVASVYSLSGKLIATKSVVGGSATFPLSKGAYIVKVGNKITKVIL